MTLPSDSVPGPLLFFTRKENRDRTRVSGTDRLDTRHTPGLLWNMNTSLLWLLLVHSLVLLRASLGASTAERAHTSPTVGRVSPVQHDYNYRSNEEDHSGDYYEPDYPRVTSSTKPKDPSVMPSIQNRRKKKNPCLRRKYRSYCIHGQCQYLEGLNHTSCICDPGYSGERCHVFTLPVGKKVEGYNQTTALAVMAVILSLMCLTFIGILLAFRCHKKRDNDMEREEKIKLEAATVQ